MKKILVVTHVKDNCKQLINILCIGKHTFTCEKYEKTLKKCMSDYLCPWLSIKRYIDKKISLQTHLP